MDERASEHVLRDRVFIQIANIYSVRNLRHNTVADVGLQKNKCVNGKGDRLGMVAGSLAYDAGPRRLRPRFGPSGR